MSDSHKWYEKVIVGDTAVDYIEYSVNVWKEHISKLVDAVEKIEVKEIKLLTYCSILEMMAQEYNNFPIERLQDSFAKFVLKFQNKYNFLEKSDPITLFYREEQIIGSIVNLNDLEEKVIYYSDTKIISDKLDEIKNVLIEQKGKDYTEKKLKQHRYVELLYRMRCRVTHEFSAAHVWETEMPEVFYVHCSRGYVSKGEWVEDEVWHLKFQVNFVKDLCLNCAENYLNYCLQNRIPPNKNNGLDRFCELSWYSR